MIIIPSKQKLLLRIKKSKVLICDLQWLHRFAGKEIYIHMFCYIYSYIYVYIYIYIYMHKCVIKMSYDEIIFTYLLCGLSPQALGRYSSLADSVCFCFVCISKKSTGPAHSRITVITRLSRDLPKAREG
jgi:hypothetical protein